MAIIKSPIKVIVQRLNIGQVWDGTLPTTTPVYPTDAVGASTGPEATIEYPADDTGGMFDLVGDRNRYKKLLGVPDRHQESFQRIRQIAMVLGGQSVWTLSLTDGDDTIDIYSGTNETNVFYSDLNIVVEPGWYLSLTSTDNSNVEHMVRIVYASRDTSSLLI